MNQLKPLAKKIFEWQARAVLKLYKPKIIAVTGSVGKSLTKEAIYLCLSKKYFVRKSEKSFTAELGVALTIIGCPTGTGTALDWARNLLLGFRLLLWRRSYPEYLILEIDGDKTGDLSRVSKFISPDILVMTAIGEVPSHIEAFPDMESFLFEKRSMINAVKREGVIIYNADDSVTANLLQDTVINKISCALGGGADFVGTDLEILYANEKTSRVPTGMSFEIKARGEADKITTFQSIGVQNQYAILLAFAVASNFGMVRSQIVASLNKFTALPARMNIISGIKDTTIIDDSYNSSPVALSYAVSVFGDIKTKGKRVAVIGDMMELGKYSGIEHRKAAEMLSKKVDFVICVGIRSRKISEELQNFGFSESKILSVGSSEEAGKELQRILSVGDLVLVKGSQVMRMERVVEEVMRHPEDKRKILVRQEEEWLSRSE
ncbi:MAG: UDP-N-acetylmuramoyl-tripeptide--D-alanyl-D-alanine ligase [Candidatus Zambryskibacteria bacterium]|nr:UDP-N-acetylmuramoyl-tripeptide--D-alanyl-D-alanine ligase [Candidatus Zambryskibacteria bacterium]